MGKTAQSLLYRILIVALLAAIIQLALPVKDTHAATPEKLPVLAHVGPWPVVSEPILYRGRLWFANSVKGIDHNSADIYSLAPASAEVRYERHLWSQDAGEPVVAKNLLYWPSEDSRLFGDWGAFQVTNGERWKTGLIPHGGIFHVHSMAAADGLLYAATSAWQAAIHVSADQGRIWRRIYRHPKSPEGISRIVSLTAVRDRVVGVLRGPQGYRLISAVADNVRLVEGWPAGTTRTPLAALDNWIFGLVKVSGGTELWRTDGVRAERIRRFAPSVRPFALTSGNGALWALTSTETGGSVIRSATGRQWTKAALFEGGDAHGLLAAEGALVVTGAGADGRGILWGRFRTGTTSANDPPADLPALMPFGEARRVDWKDAASRLESLLSDPQSYKNVGRGIRDVVFDLALAGPPPNFFVNRLESPRPPGSLNPFRDVTIPDQGSIGALWLLWGLGLTKNGVVPPRLIAAPWTVPENSAAKYFEPHLMAMWAASEIGQADRATIDALMGRITKRSDPLWLRMDAVGALTALTGARHGADFAAWAKWNGR